VREGRHIYISHIGIAIKLISYIYRYIYNIYVFYFFSENRLGLQWYYIKCELCIRSPGMWCVNGEISSVVEYILLSASDNITVYIRIALQMYVQRPLTLRGRVKYNCNNIIFRYNLHNIPINYFVQRCKINI